MRINHLTFHCALNYGAVLQTYALGRVLKDMGHSVRLLDLRPPAVAPGRTLSPRGWLQRIRFSRFLGRYCPSATARTTVPGRLGSLAPPADACIVGSDQVWNPGITGSFAGEYFLSFVPGGCRRVAYAASFGCDTLKWEAPLRRDATGWLATFDGISVRESSGLALLAELGVRDAVVALDPTLLLGDFRELTGAAAPRDELLCMVFEPRDPFADAAVAMARRLALQPVVLGRRAPDRRFGARVAPGVPEWVRSFHRAAFIITDSFHGLAFSILFRKPFAVVPANPDRFCRLRDLLKVLGLEDRVFPDYGALLKDGWWRDAVPFDDVDQRLAAMRGASRAFLASQLDTGSSGKCGLSS